MEQNDDHFPQATKFRKQAFAIIQQFYMQIEYYYSLVVRNCVAYGVLHPTLPQTVLYQNLLNVYAHIKGHLEPTHLKFSPLFTFSTKSLGQDSPSIHFFFFLQQLGQDSLPQK